MAINRRDELNKILAEAAEKGIPVPSDVILEIAKQDAQGLIDTDSREIRFSLEQLREIVFGKFASLEKQAVTLWPANALSGIIPYVHLPIFGLRTPGAVPAPMEEGLWLNSLGWRNMPKPEIRMFGGGGKIVQSAAQLTGLLLALSLLPNAIGWLQNDGAGNLIWSTPPGAGDFDGPAGATDGDFVQFDTATGKLGKDGGYSPASFALAGHDHALLYLPILGAGDIYTHNAAEFALAGHNHAGVYLPTAGAGDIYTHDASEFAPSGSAHSPVTLDVNADTLLALSTQALGLDTQDPAKVFAGPVSGADAVPTFRALEETDLPATIPNEAWVQAQIAGIGAGSVVGTFLIGGGGVTWKSGYTFTVAAGSGYIDGVLMTWTQQDIALTAADVTNDRIDVIAVDSGGTVIKIDGAADPNPSEPVVDPSLQLKLAFVFVTHNTASPPGITSELIYAENAGSPTEWGWTTSGSGFDVNSTNNPKAGSKDIEGTTVTAGSYALGARGSGTIDPANYTQLVFYLRFKNTWNANRYLQVQFQNAGVRKGNALRISNGQFGLDSSNTTTYQAVVIPMMQFAIPGGTLVNQLRFIDVGGSIGFYVDDIEVTNGGIGGTVINGITQDQADARYVQKSEVTSDVTTYNASTSSHGLIIKPVAPAAGLTTIPAIENGETVWKNKALFDSTNPAALGVAAPGTQLIAARRDHVHAAPAAMVYQITKTVSNPQLIYTQRPEVPLFQAMANLHISRILVRGNDSSPTAELAGDLKKADDTYDGSFANAAVIVACDTTNGAFLDTNSYAVAADKFVYFKFDASPHADWKDVYFDIRFTLD